MAVNIKSSAQKEMLERALSACKQSTEKVLEWEGKFKQAQAALEGNNRLCSILAVALEHYQRMAGEIK